MSNDSEKADKTGKQIVARFLLVLAILLVVLIPPTGLSIALGLALDWAWAKVAYDWVIKACNCALNWVMHGCAWKWIKASWDWVLELWFLNPEPSESFIGKIVFLFIAICLILFLLSWKAADIKESLSKIKKKISEAFRCLQPPSSVTWLSYFATVGRAMKDVFTESLKLVLLRLGSRFLLLLVMLATVLLPLIVLCLALYRALDWVEDPFSKLNQNQKNKNLMRTITLLTSIGLISFMLQESLKKVKDSLYNILQSVRKVFGGISWTSLCEKGSSWMIYWDTFTASLKLVLSALILCIIFVCSFITLKSLGIEDKPETNRENPLVPPHTHPFDKSTQYSLFYRSQGDLATKEGICPTDSNLVNWLTSFKSAISSCSEDSAKVSLKVQAFASTAPVTKKSNLNPATSNMFNREIANQRAQAIIYFLTTEPDTSYFWQFHKPLKFSSLS